MYDDISGDKKDTLVCCSTCHNKNCGYLSFKQLEDKKECLSDSDLKKECLSDSDLMLYWSEETGYLPKLIDKCKYRFWKGKESPEEFIKKEEMIL